MGAAPWHYFVFRAADRLGCSVFELIARPDYYYWKEWALTILTAELEAKAELDRRNSKNGGGGGYGPGARPQPMPIGQFEKSSDNPPKFLGSD